LAASQLRIAMGESSSLLTHIAVTENGLSRATEEELTTFVELQLAVKLD
jgi:hypothetical protein